MVGRHNWTFCGSDDGAEWNAIATTLIASCQRDGVERWAYLRDVLTLLPAWPKRDVLQLAPKFWNQTLQHAFGVRGTPVTPRRTLARAVSSERN